VNQLGVCPPGTPGDQCALSLQSKFSGSTAGNARITYSPGTMRHLLENYGTMLDCLHTLDVLTFSTIPPNEDQNFSHCFTEEFPKDAVLMKAHWVRADFNRKMPAFDTDGAALAERLASTKVADWGGGDRMVDPTPDEVFTIRLKGGDTYRLAGLHIMSKELRHWMWITLWWSDEPNVDFGADRPATMAALDPVWSRYKMGVVVDYNEADLNPAQWFPNAPTLAASLQAVQHERSWLSNPYIEHGRGNARTNCVGCHQHGGSTVGHDLNGDGAPDAFDLEAVIDNETLFQHNGRAQMRSVFPADYLWSTTRVDDLSELLRSEVTNWDIQDQLDPTIRALAILNLEGDASVGSARFQKSCSTCHGAEGAGTGAAPSLYDRVPKLDDEGLAAILLSGRAPMPSWSHLDNQELADVIAFLRENFSLTP
jgi:mono/diheme cytochrome c family protein